MKKTILITMFLIGTVWSTFAQSSPSNPRQLNEAISSADITLTARGNGSSSGAAIDGTLKNNTSRPIYINVNLDDGIYLLNSGSGQNMIATNILLANGRYSMLGGKNRFISLQPNSNTGIIMIAFCANYERENPLNTETFTSAYMPADLANISAKIAKYIADNFDSDEDFTIPAQLALWAAQGLNQKQIRKQFYFNSSDWEISASIQNY